MDDLMFNMLIWRLLCDIDDVLKNAGCSTRFLTFGQRRVCYNRRQACETEDTDRRGLLR